MKQPDNHKGHFRQRLLPMDASKAPPGWEYGCVKESNHSFALTVPVRSSAMNHTEIFCLACNPVRAAWHQHRPGPKDNASHMATKAHYSAETLDDELTTSTSKVPYCITTQLATEVPASTSSPSPSPPPVQPIALDQTARQHRSLHYAWLPQA